jgi:hypothetical protein
MKTNVRLEVMKVFDADGACTHWAVNMHISPLPDEDVAKYFADRLAKSSRRSLRLDTPFAPLAPMQ